MMAVFHLSPSARIDIQTSTYARHSHPHILRRPKRHWQRNIIHIHRLRSLYELSQPRDKVGVLANLPIYTHDHLVHLLNFLIPV
jgi:hypothetical protein